MWKRSQPDPKSSGSIPKSEHAVLPASVFEPAGDTRASTNNETHIGKGLSVKGEISGEDPLLIDGKVEGTINLPGSRVTVGNNGQVRAPVTAREVVVLGNIVGNVTTSHRVDIRAEGSLTGDVVCASIRIEDGGYFKGCITIREPKDKPARSIASPREAAKLTQV
jgi:cytoskeletal protein CcmA (bactofilin family)